MSSETAQFRKGAEENPEEQAFREKLRKEATTELMEMWLEKQNWVEAAKQNIVTLQTKKENTGTAVKTYETQSGQALMMLDAIRKRPDTKAAIAAKKSALAAQYRTNPGEQFHKELSRLEDLMGKLGI